MEENLFKDERDDCSYLLGLVDEFLFDIRKWRIEELRQRLTVLQEKITRYRSFELFDEFVLLEKDLSSAGNNGGLDQKQIRKTKVVLFEVLKNFRQIPSRTPENFSKYLPRDFKNSNFEEIRTKLEILRAEEKRKVGDFSGFKLTIEPIPNSHDSHDSHEFVVEKTKPPTKKPTVEKTKPPKKDTRFFKLQKTKDLMKTEFSTFKGLSSSFTQKLLEFLDVFQVLVMDHEELMEDYFSFLELLKVFGWDVDGYGGFTSEPNPQKIIAEILACCE